MSINFNQYAAEGNTFLNEYAKEMAMENDKDKAGRILVAILHALREIISIEESIQLVAQLPMFLKALYVNRWSTRGRNRKIKNMEHFMDLVREFDGSAAVNDFGYENDLLERYIDVTVIYMGNYISQGEMEDIRDGLPKDLKNLIHTKLMF
ncbi:DUF2267 domain-containing protein [Zeaxanthinibacter enoshimensis]|uniref:Uncharacterized protein (DUF2267 family) n=1 Tax=Zeaxanthinibacter enoshimensis TaxID=392009 RepID=A0A4V3D3R8_9FLAO|nr:DUF2267 domain-containing protein [Zeaxanthinibacter enoshimensis]TDQ31073.1 uncharacterized protein (DUF2267 family) [Zeaxanthinibacter enoshimensis]